MNDSMNLLGPAGIQQRIAEIQAQLDTALGIRAQKSVKPGKGFVSELSGAIGKPTVDDGFAPLAPLAPGTNLESKAAPELRSLIGGAARDAGIDEDLFDSLVAVESGYDPNARSKVGAMGLTQLMPGTAEALGVSKPFDAAENLQGGAKYLASMIKRFGSPELALAAYNAGPGAVTRAGNAIPPFPETQHYVKKIMSLYNSRKAR